MRNRNANVFLRGTAIALLIVATVLTIASLVGYSRQRNDYPAGMTIAGVPVGGQDPQAASERVLEVYNTPIEIHYGDAIIQADPTNLGFQLDIDSMLAAADLTRTGGSFWGGFWDYLWNRDPTPVPVPLRATIAEDRLRNYLQTEITPRYDRPPVPAQLAPGSTTSFTPGQAGQTLDVDKAVPLIEDALRSSTNRAVTLTSTTGAVARPTLDNLQLLLKKNVLDSGFDGVIGVYMLDLQNGQEIHFAMDRGQEISVEPDVAFTASSTIKIPILVAYFIQHGSAPVTSSVNAEIVNMIHKSDNIASDDVMAELDPNTGPLIVTQDLRKLGIENTFMAGFFHPGAPLLQRFSTPSNQRTDVATDPDVYNQTTPADMGMLLEDVYQCSETGGGALIAAFPDKITQDVCKEIINYLEQDKIGVLLEAGVPEGTQVAMKHGWIPGGDGVLHDVSAAGIVYSSGGNFVLSVYTYHPVQNLFDTTNRLVANLTRAVYNYYNLTSQ